MRIENSHNFATGREKLLSLISNVKLRLPVICNLDIFPLRYGHLLSGHLPSALFAISDLARFARQIANVTDSKCLATKCAALLTLKLTLNWTNFLLLQWYILPIALLRRPNNTVLSTRLCLHTAQTHCRQKIHNFSHKFFLIFVTFRTGNQNKMQKQ